MQAAPTAKGSPSMEDASPGSLDLASIEALIATLPDLFFLLSPDGRIIRYRAGEASHLYGNPARFPGARPEDLLPEDVAAVFTETLDRCRATGRLESCEYQLHLPQGPLWFEARLQATPNGEHIVCLVRDISPHRGALERLQIYESAVSS